MSSHIETYRTSLAFPAKLDESWTVRDGLARPVERWTVLGRQDFKTASEIKVRIETLRAA